MKSLSFLFSLFIFVLPTFVLAKSCDPEKMGFFDYLSCGDQGVNNNISLYEDELTNQRQINSDLMQEQEELEQKKLMILNKISQIEEQNRVLLSQIEKLNSAVALYTETIDSYNSSLEEKENSARILIAQLDSTARTIDKAVELSDVSYDEFKLMKSAIGVASDIRDFNKHKKEVDKAKGASSKLKVASKGVGKMILKKGFFKLVPGLGLVDTIMDVVNVATGIFDWFFG